MLPAEDTICALATPPGTGGIGVIRISGPASFAIADTVTRRPKETPCARFAGHTLHRADVIETGGEIIDDVLLAIFHAPRSYTGEDVVEISAHGGPIPLRRILARLLASGARMAKPGEFTQRAFLNGRMDLSQAEAVGDGIAARTEEAHQLARRQQAGRLSGQVAQIRDTILGVLARIEAFIDFPEDVGELDTEFCKNELCAADQRLTALLTTAERGILYREGLKVVLMGRPNVGKSSLLNALLRAARAIVTPLPGTTRDVIEETLNLRGIPVRVVDTAGLRETEDMIERLGVERTRESIDAADFVVLVLDATAGETSEDADLRRSLGRTPHVVVWNKWDLVDSGACARPQDSPRSAPPELGGGGLLGAGGVYPLSAVTGWNIDALEDAIADSVLCGQAAPLDSETAVVTHARHRHALETARLRLADARDSLERAMPADFVSIDVRSALMALGEITGETATEDIISEIFSRFCIGK